MTHWISIQVRVLPDLEEQALHQYSVNATSFAKQVGVEARFSKPTDAQGDRTSVIDGPPALIVIPSGRLTEDNGDGARIRMDLLERASTPILLLSPKVDLSKAPIRSVLVPMSGEIRVSAALKFGLRLARRIQVPVDLVHVVGSGAQKRSALEMTGDQPHHEYRELLDRVLAEASPFSDTRERAQVRTLYNVEGTPAVEILKAAGKTPSCALVAEWHGSLLKGKAEILKDLLRQTEIPIFLVKTESEQKSVLRIGPEKRVA
jgi:nucleotide-binding universal stress UspA family protein